MKREVYPVGSGGGGGGFGRPLRGMLAAMALLVLLYAACGEESPRGSEGTVVALVNGEAIDLREYQEKLAVQFALAGVEASLKAADRDRLREVALSRLIQESLMFQRARELSLTVDEAELSAKIEELKGDYSGEEFNALFGEDRISFPRWKEALRRRMLFEKLIEKDVNAAIVVSDDEARSHYEAHRKTYETQRRVRAAQIVTRDDKRAAEILKRLKAGEDFGKVAREVSIGPEATQGGDLGFFERGIMPEAIDRVVFALPVGRLSAVVQSPYGYHIFKVLAREGAGGKTFPEVRERVVDDLRRRKEVAAYEVWAEALKARAVIEIARPLPDISLGSLASP